MTHPSSVLARQRLPHRREHRAISFTTAEGFRYTAGLGYFDDGRLAELFLNAEKVGTAKRVTAQWWPVSPFRTACQRTPFATR
jgi:hypothetical protein